MNEVAKTDKKDINKEHDLSVIEQVVMQGDLSKLNPEQRVTYYHKVCDSLGLNPYTRPFDYISLNGKLTLYAKKDATEQLRSVKNISILELDGRLIDDLYVVTAKAATSSGRTDQATGAVSLGALRGEQKANAIMKAETKAKRRVTLSICGLGWTDESELESMPFAKTVNVDMATGEISGETKLLANDNAKISDKQYDTLNDFFIGCSELAQKSIRDILKNEYNGIWLNDLPMAAFERFKGLLEVRYTHHKQQKELLEREMADRPEVNE